MLNKEQYKKLWKDQFSKLKPIVKKEVKMPDYNEYLLRERMFQDYLDIFRGKNTRKEGFEMPYEHPFFGSDGETPILKEKPCIKYIMIGECAAPLNPVIPVLGNCAIPHGDSNNTYFYNILHLGNTPYLNAPRLAFGCPSYRPCPENKIKTLLCLASKGVLLIDLFPFAIPFAPIRRILNGFGITLSYWNDPGNPYNLESRIISINHLLCDKWDLCMVAPNTISEFIVDPINGFPELAIVPPGLHAGNFRDILPDVTRPNDWKKIAVTTAGSPSAHLITLAFDL